MKRIHLMCVGGGSGGHVTPILPVIAELSKSHKLKVELVVDSGFYPQARGLIEKSGLPIKLHTISSGRLRRYAHFKWHDYLGNPKMMFENLVDMFKASAGYAQSLWLLRKKPDAVFAKGGFVSLPLGLAAKTRGIPIIIHDSDARPGLTNRVLSRFASRIATGTPLENYNYPAEITRYTGVPISPAYHPYSPEEQARFKQALGFQPDQPLIVVTGGGLGAQSINDAILQGADDLLAAGFQVYHVTGKTDYSAAKAKQPADSAYKLIDFVYSGMVQVLAAADLVVSRASATTIQELAGLAKPTILVPARHLGDQVQNAQIYQASHSAVIVDDEQIRVSKVLTDSIIQLMNQPEEMAVLAQNLHSYARPQAAREIADMILEVVT